MKIKADRIKDLEKFGFSYHSKGWYKEIITDWRNDFIWVDDERKVTIMPHSDSSISTICLDEIYKLIKADMVED